MGYKEREWDEQRGREEGWKEGRENEMEGRDKQIGTRGRGSASNIANGR